MKWLKIIVSKIILLKIGSFLSMKLPLTEVNPIDVFEVLPCIVNITERYYKNTQFLFIAEEVYRIKSFHQILNNLSGTYLIQNESKFDGKFGFFLFFPQYEKNYNNIFNVILSFTYNRFLIYWPHFNANTSHIYHFVSEFWEFKLLNVAILSLNREGNYDVHTYDPYTELSCNKPQSLLILDVWNVTSKEFLYNNDLFPLADKLKNLNGCELVSFAKNRPPDSIVKQLDSNSWKLEGIGGKLMEEVQKRINFTPIIKVPKMNVSVDKYGYDISNGFPELVTKMLNNFSADLAFGIYSHIIYDNPRVEFATTSVSECYGWAVPAHGGKVIPAWMYYTQEFNLIVWILILIVFLFCIVIFHFMTKLYHDSLKSINSFDSAVLYIFSLNLGISISPRMKFIQLRLWVAIIILYSLIISSAYQSSLGSFLTVPWQRDNIKSFHEILEANYNLIGIPQGKRILQRFSTDNKISNELSSYFQVHKNHFDSVIQRIQREKDTATFGAQRFIQFYISNELNGTGREEIYLLPKCVIQAHASPFLFKKGSPFLKPINKIISAAVESGLTDFWFAYSTPKIVRTLAAIFPLTLQQLKCAFAILIIGNGLATVAFIVEMKRKHSHNM